MAAKAGQILQAELLVVYGADPGAPDINGRTPMDYARYKTMGTHLIKSTVCIQFKAQIQSAVGEL